MAREVGVHRESWTFSQEERKIAMLISEYWKKSGRTVTVKEDTQNITVSSMLICSYEINRDG